MYDWRANDGSEEKKAKSRANKSTRQPKGGGENIKELFEKEMDLVLLVRGCVNGAMLNWLKLTRHAGIIAFFQVRSISWRG